MTDHEESELRALADRLLGIADGDNLGPPPFEGLTDEEFARQFAPLARAWKRDHPARDPEATMMCYAGRVANMPVMMLGMAEPWQFTEPMARIAPCLFVLPPFEWTVPMRSLSPRKPKEEAQR